MARGLRQVRRPFAGPLGVCAWLLALAPLVVAQQSGDPDAPASWSTWGDGPWESRRGAWTWEARGLFSVHARRYDSDNAKSSGLETKALSPIFEARHDDGTRVYVEGDLDGDYSRTNLWEAWAEVPLGKRHWVRAGRQRIATGTELATRSEDHAFIGYAFPAYQAGRWDSAVRFDGYANNQLWYELVATSGNGFDLQGRRRQDAYYAARLMLTPQPDGGADGETDPGDFHGPFGGFTYGMNPDYDDHIQLATPFDNVVFTTADLDAGGATWEHLELGWRGRSWRVGYEQTDGEITDVPLPGGGERDFDQLTTFAIYTVVNLRGEPSRWIRGRWVPVLSKDRDAELPLEIAFRYTNADIDRDLFDAGFTSYDPSTQEVRTFSAAISGYVDTESRLTFQWVNVIADDELTTLGGTNRDSSFVLRYDRWFGRNPAVSRGVTPTAYGID